MFLFDCNREKAKLDGARMQVDDNTSGEEIVSSRDTVSMTTGNSIDLGNRFHVCHQSSRTTILVTTRTNDAAFCSIVHLLSSLSFCRSVSQVKNY